MEGLPPTSGVINFALDDKDSETRYEVLIAGAGATLLAVTPISGRMHQIRRHLEGIGHPVLGDKRYGSQQLPDYEGFALHSFRTALLLPDTTSLTVCAPVPEGFLALCEQHGIGQATMLSAVRDRAVGSTFQAAE